MEISPEELKIEAWPPRNVGGQIVGISSGVRITHIPTGLVAISTEQYSQHRNKSICMDMLLGGLTSPHFR